MMKWGLKSMTKNKLGSVLYFEGVDASGKGTQLRLAERYLVNKGYKVVIKRQPGGTYAGKLIRELILDSDANISELARVYLFAADRAMLNCEIEKAILDGAIVLCDRSILSSYVYQDACSFATVERANQDAMKALERFNQRTMLFSVSGDVAFERMELRDKYTEQKKDNIEKQLDKNKLQKLNDSYLKYLDYVPRGHEIKADSKELEVFEETKVILDKVINEYENINNNK